MGVYQRFYHTVRDLQGNAVAGASCTVYNSGTQTLATIYNASTPDSNPGGMSNPFATVADGVVSFFALDGQYDVQITGGSIASQTMRITLSTADAGIGAVAATDLADTSSLALGDALVGVNQPFPGAVGRTQHSKNSDIVNARDFGILLDGTDESARLQAAVDYCSSDNEAEAKTLILPPGTIKGSFVLKKQFIRIDGAGMWSSRIDFGTAAAGISTLAMPYLRPFLSNFSVYSTEGTGKGIDLSTVTNEVYGGEIRNVACYAVGDGFYAPRFFSMLMANVYASSSSGHAFRVACGPGVSWHSCYAVNTGSGKAGYRLTGMINMFGCNGVNSGDWWGVFGCDTTAADGFQTDFAADDLPDINMVGCNVEEFSSVSTNGGGIMAHNAFRSFNVIGGKFDRNNLGTAYKAVIQIKKGANTAGNPVRLRAGSVFLGAGTPSLAYLYSDVPGYFLDEGGSFALGGVATWKNGSSGLSYPIMTETVGGDLFGDNAIRNNALWPRRLTISMSRYRTTTLTPVGAGQSIVVTGFNKVIVTPAAAASITTATFDQTIGAGLDYLRNGELIIEAGNANLTVNHSASGADTFKLAGGANLTMTAGQVIRFLRSETNGSWVQV